MILYFIVVFLFIASIVGVILFNNKYCETGTIISAIVAIFSGVFVMIVSVYMSVRGGEGRNFRSDREYYQEALYKSEGKTYAKSYEHGADKAAAVLVKMYCAAHGYQCNNTAD